MYLHQNVVSFVWVFGDCAHFFSTSNQNSLFKNNNKQEQQQQQQSGERKKINTENVNSLFAPPVMVMNNETTHFIQRE